MCVCVCVLLCGGSGGGDVCVCVCVLERDGPPYYRKFHVNAVKKERKEKIDAATSCMCLNRWDIDFVPEAIASST